MFKWIKTWEDFIFFAMGMALIIAVLGAAITGRGCNDYEPRECTPTIKVLSPSWIRSPSFTCDHEKHVMKVDRTLRAITVTCECPVKP